VGKAIIHRIGVVTQSHSHRGRIQLKKYLSSVAAIAIVAGSAGAVRADDSATVGTSGITFYGVVDAGVTYEAHGTTPQGTGSVGTLYLVTKPGNKATFTASQSGLSQSRWGIKGAEDLGDGWTGLFKLEGGFNPLGGQITDGIRTVVNQNGLPTAQQSSVADSSQAGQLFGRAAYVGISNPKYGSLTVGRQTILENDIIGQYDPMGQSYAFSIVGFSGAYGGAGNTEDVRWDNSVKYVGSYGPVHAGVMYQLGGTITRNDVGYSADVGAEYGPFSVDATWTHKKDEVGAGPLSAAQMISVAAAGYNSQNAFAATVSDNTQYGVNASYKWEKFKFFANYEYVKYSNPSSPLGTGFIDIGNYIGAVVNNTAFTNNKTLNVYWGGVKYSAMPKLDIAAAYYRVEQNSYATGANAGCNDTRAGNCSGTENVASVMADWHFTKKFDAYVGAMYSQVINGLANGYIHNNQIDPTIGLRYTW